MCIRDRLDSMPKTARLASISLPCLDDAVFGAIRRPTFWTINRGFFLYKLSQYNGCYTKLTMPLFLINLVQSLIYLNGLPLYSVSISFICISLPPSITLFCHSPDSCVPFQKYNFFLHSLLLIIPPFRRIIQ